MPGSNHHRVGSYAKILALLLAATVASCPAAAQAAGLAFRNDTDGPIFVQGMMIVNRVARRGKLHILRPGEVSREAVLVPGMILIRVTDGNQPSRVLCEKTIPFTGTDLFLAVQADEPEKPAQGDKPAPEPKDRRTTPLRVKLVPVKPTPPVKPPVRH